MGNFSINGIDYQILRSKPEPSARYGLALTFWKTNLEELCFALKLISHWPRRRLVNVSVCSAMDFEPPPECNFATRCLVDRGHQDGTMDHCNGAIWPLASLGLNAVAHTDADTIFLNEHYFFGHAERLRHAEKVLLTSMSTFQWNQSKLCLEPLDEDKGPGLGRITNQFGSTFFVHGAFVGRLFPCEARGNFETDRYRYFMEQGFSLEDAIILPRYPMANMSEMDFSLGVMHNANTDREYRRNKLLELNGLSRE